jgi:hypothetical protein
MLYQAIPEVRTQIEARPYRFHSILNGLFPLSETSLFRWSCIVWLGIASPAWSAAGAEYVSGFDDSQTFNSVWDRCEAASPTNPILKSVTYGADTREVVRFIVDPSTGNMENKCSTRGVVNGLVPPVEQDPDRDALAGSALADPQGETQGWSVRFAFQKRSSLRWSTFSPGGQSG